MDPDQLTLLALGEPLGDAEDAATTGHLQRCLACRDELRSLRETIGLARETVEFREGLSAPPASVWDRIVAEAGIGPTTATRQHPSSDLPAPRSMPPASRPTGPSDRSAGTDPGRWSGSGRSTGPGGLGGSSRSTDRSDPGRSTDPVGPAVPTGPSGPTDPDRRTELTGRTDPTGRTGLGGRSHLAGPADRSGPAGRGGSTGSSDPTATGPTVAGPGPASRGGVGRHRSPDGPATAPGADGARVLPLRRWGTVATAAVAAAAVGVVGTLAAVRPWEEDTAPVVVASASTSLEPVSGGPGGVTGRAVVVRGAAGPRLEVTAAGLPSPEGYYEVWMFDGINRMVSVGTLGPDSTAALPLPATMDLATFRVVDISAERYDGEQTHSQDSVLRGTLDS